MTPSRPKELWECYRALGVRPGASPGHVKSQYRRLARRWHPDRFAAYPEEKRLAEEKMKAVNAAYRRIREADVHGGRPISGTPPPPGARFVWPPEPRWERPCPGCGRWMAVEGNRYVYCPACGLGFFPQNEGEFVDLAEQLEPTPAEVAGVSACALAFLIVDVFGPSPINLSILAMAGLFFLGARAWRWWLETRPLAGDGVVPPRER